MSVAMASHSNVVDNNITALVFATNLKHSAMPARATDWVLRAA